MIVPVIAPKYENTIQKIKDNLAYPLEIFKNKNLNKTKKEYNIFRVLENELIFEVIYPLFLLFEYFIIMS